MEELQQIGRRVRDRRLQCNLTQGELGVRCQVATTTIYRIEHGVVEATTGSLSKIAAALGVSEHFLLTGVEPDEPAIAAANDVHASTVPMVPLVVAELIGTGRLGPVTRREILAMCREHEHSDGDMDSLEHRFLLWRFRNAPAADRDKAEAALMASLRRVSTERGESDAPLARADTSPPPPRKPQPRARPRR